MLTPSSGFGSATNRGTYHINPTGNGGASAGPAVSQTFSTKTAPPSLPTSHPPEETPPVLISTLPVVATIGTITATANAESALVIGMSTVKPGEQIIYSGTTISMAADGRSLDVDGKTQYLSVSHAMGTQPLAAGTAVVILSGTTYFAPTNPLAAASVSSVFENFSSELPILVTGASNISSDQQFWMPAYFISGQMLIAGGTPITVSRTTMSLEPDGSIVIIVLATTMTEDVSVLLGTSLSSTQAESSESSSSSSDIETEIETSLGAPLNS